MWNYKQHQWEAMPNMQGLVYGTISGTAEAYWAVFSPTGTGTGKIMVCENPGVLTHITFQGVSQWLKNEDTD